MLAPKSSLFTRNLEQYGSQKINDKKSYGAFSSEYGFGLFFINRMACVNSFPLAIHKRIKKEVSYYNFLFILLLI